MDTLLTMDDIVKISVNKAKKSLSANSTTGQRGVTIPYTMLTLLQIKFVSENVPVVRN